MSGQGGNVSSENQRIDVYLVCNAKYHDTNFARLELLKLLAEHEDIWTRVSDNFSDSQGICDSTLLITYTCDLCPTEAEQDGLEHFLQGGGRWLALHGTSALIEFVDGKADTPDKAPRFMRMLGNRFVAHPPIEPFTVRVSDPQHPLVRGIDAFDVEDEPYYCEYFGDNKVLLEATYNAPSNGYVRSGFGTDRQVHPQMYLHPYAAGEVLYLALGHCTGKYDMQPLMDVAPVARGAWRTKEYYELLRRSIRWGIGAL